LKIYPNPSTGKIILSGVPEAGNISVFDNMGNHVMEFSKLSGNTMDLGSLPNGLYMVRLQTHEGVKTARVNILK
jgi:hypothetical protein